jgi:hypothetical protein
MMNAREMRDYIRIVDAMSRLYPKLPRFAAVKVLNFYKSRFVKGQDIYGRAFRKRKDAGKKNRGRAILVKRGVLKRDLQIISVTSERVIIGTTRLTRGYAKAHNEGFTGTVTVGAYRRRRFRNVKESYTDKKGKQRKRTSKQIDDSKGPIQVGTHRRKMDIAKRQFAGVSPMVEKVVVQEVQDQMISTLKKNSSKI